MISRLLPGCASFGYACNGYRYYRHYGNVVIRTKYGVKHRGIHEGFGYIVGSEYYVVYRCIYIYISVIVACVR